MQNNINSKIPMPKHYTIPIFVPELACPHQCSFCNQRKISGQAHIPNPEEAYQKIEDYLQSMPKDKEKWVEIGFFGGSFTGIPMAQQEAFLSIAKKYIENHDIQGIRLSTRPDYINQEVLDFLQYYKVSTIELGAQSTHNEVLEKSERGHSKADIKTAALAIKKAGFRLGLQMMIGLPLDSYKRSMQTARDIVAWGADESRIYPCLVVRHTQLAKEYLKGHYQPLSLDTAVAWSKNIWLYLESQGVNVIRIGLHPSEEFETTKGLLAGPYHHSFKALVMTEIWYDILSQKLNEVEQHSTLKTVYVPPKAMAVAVGHHTRNKTRLRTTFGAVNIKPDPKLKNRECYVDCC